MAFTKSETQLQKIMAVCADHRDQQTYTYSEVIGWVWSKYAFVLANQSLAALIHRHTKKRKIFNQFGGGKFSINWDAAAIAKQDGIL